MTSHAKTGPKALVAVFKNSESAIEAIKVLHDAGFPIEKMEWVAHDFHKESPDVETPEVGETTTSSMLESAEKWGAAGVGAGAAAGLLAAVLTPFPGIAIGMLFAGGLTGSIVGGMAGVEHAVDDDSVNLPTIDEYEQLLHDGCQMVVVHGPHADMLRAKEVISHLPFIHDHLHPMHGHEFHEHPSHGNATG